MEGIEREQWEKLLKELGRMEEAVRHVALRMSSLEQAYKEADSGIWEGIRRKVGEVRAECEKAKAEILDLVKKEEDREIPRFQDLIASLDDRVKGLEDRIIGAEMDICAGETKTKNVVGLETKIDKLSEKLNETGKDLAVDMTSVNTRLDTLVKTVAELKESSWRKLQAIMTILALLLSLLMAGFTILKEVLKPNVQQPISGPQQPGGR